MNHLYAKAEKLCKAILEKVKDCGETPQKDEAVKIISEDIEAVQSQKKETKNPEITKHEVIEKPNSQQSEVADSRPRKRRHIRRGTYDLNDEDNVNKIESNDTVVKDFVVTKKPRKSCSPKPNVRQLKSSIPRPRRKNAPALTPNMRSHTPHKNSSCQLTMTKPAVKSIISRTPNFARIHEKAFSKMDSLDKFLQKKQQRSAMLLKSPLPIVAIKSIQKENKSVPTASKIPKFGMPTKPLDFSFGKLPVEGKIFKFSAAKPSTNKVALVKPRTMKTLSENPQNFCSKNFSLHKIRQEKEKQEIIKGVRSNRRFELQMKNRRVISK